MDKNRNSALTDEIILNSNAAPNVDQGQEPNLEPSTTQTLEAETEPNTTPVERNQENVEFALKCSKCGAELSEGNDFCPKCGNKVGDVKKSTNKKHLIIGVATLAVLAVVAVVLVVMFSSRNNVNTDDANTVDFRAIYETCGYEDWVKIGVDESYLSIDTNPSNISYKAENYPEALAAIAYANAQLNLPDYLFNDMLETRALDGVQSETFEDIGVKISWRYHPTNGLEVTYKKIGTN